ncbi:hypothetical protein T439DRAFT_356689 [Meredithblackwellia eburnea MCA 4105]
MAPGHHPIALQQSFHVAGSNMYPAAEVVATLNQVRNCLKEGNRFREFDIRLLIDALQFIAVSWRKLHSKEPKYTALQALECLFAKRFVPFYETEEQAERQATIFQPKSFSLLPAEWEQVAKKTDGNEAASFQVTPRQSQDSLVRRATSFKLEDLVYQTKFVKKGRFGLLARVRLFLLEVGVDEDDAFQDWEVTVRCEYVILGGEKSWGPNSAEPAPPETDSISTVSVYEKQPPFKLVIEIRGHMVIQTISTSHGEFMRYGLPEGPQAAELRNGSGSVVSNERINIVPNKNQNFMVYKGAVGAGSDRRARWEDWGIPASGVDSVRAQGVTIDFMEKPFPITPFHAVSRRSSSASSSGASSSFSDGE